MEGGKEGIKGRENWGKENRINKGGRGGGRERGGHPQTDQYYRVDLGERRMRKEREVICRLFARLIFKEDLFAVPMKLGKLAPRGEGHRKVIGIGNWGLKRARDGRRLQKDRRWEGEKGRKKN